MNISAKMRSFIIAGGLSLAIASHAQFQESKFQRLSIEDGLSQSSIQAILQDSQGFMWFGTEDGLNKYDGYNFTVYRHLSTDSTSLSSNFIQALYEDQTKTLWIGTNDGLNRFNRNTATFTRYLHDPKNPHSLSHDQIRAIGEDQTGALWIGTHGGGLNRFDRQSGRFTHYKNKPDDPNSLSGNVVNTICQDDSQTLWIGTLGGGLNRFHIQSENFRRYRAAANDSSRLSSDQIISLYQDRGGTLWIGTYGGGLCRLNRDDRRTPRFTAYKHRAENPNTISHNSVNAIIEDRFGTLWLGTYAGGLGRLRRDDRPTMQFTTHKNDPAYSASLSHNRIISLCADRSGNIWIGTSVGLNKLQIMPKGFQHFSHDPVNPNSLSHQDVNAIWQDRAGNLWIGADEGLNLFDATTQKFISFKKDSTNANSLSHNFIEAVCEDRQGIIWIGTFGGGLNQWNRQTKKFKHYQRDPNDPASLSSNLVTAIVEDRDGNLWVGTVNGLNRFDRRSESFTRFRHDRKDVTSLSSSSIFNIFEDRAGNLWIATHKGGLSRMNRDNREAGKFTRYQNDPSHPNSLSDNNVLSIYEDRNGAIWVGTVDGLNKLDPATGQFIRYFESDGLPNTFIYGILGDDEGNLWLSTNNGLSKFNERLPRGKQFRNFDVKDGLQSNEFNIGAYHRGHNGELFFGGINGFNRFYPQQVRDNPNIPPVLLMAFKKFDKAADLDTAISEIKIITLSHRENFFSFEFAALDYTNPEKNQYAYKMEGFDNDWIYSGTRRYAGYTNLDPGEYVFKIKGSNNDGIWNETGAAVKIIITPPFWKTWWFRIFVASALAGLLVLIYRYRVSRLLEVERLRVRIASDLHDDIGATLTKISLHSELIQSGSEPNEIKDSLQKIGAMSRELITTMSDIVWSIDARNDTIGNLIDRMRDFAASVFSMQAVEVDFDFAGLETQKKLPVDLRQNIYLIFKEALNNIAKHAEASRVEVQIENLNEKFSMTIRDDGKGWRENEYEKLSGHGLRNMKMRAARLGGHLNISRNGGCTINLTAPALR